MEETSVAVADIQSNKGQKPELKSAEMKNDYKSEIYRRGDMVVEKKFLVSDEKAARRAIQLTVSQNGNTLSMNDLLPDGWSIIEEYGDRGARMRFGAKEI